MSSLTLQSGLLEIGTLVAGSVNTILVKATDSTFSVGWGGERRQFAHPWTQVLFMFMAESLCMIAHAFTVYNPWGCKTTAGKVPKRPERVTDLLPPILAIPMSLDLLATSSSSIGLLYCKASVWEMLRGSIIIFSCILSTLFVKRKSYAYRWVAVGITVCGLILVGLSSVLHTSKVAAESGSSEQETAQAVWKTIMGCSLVVVAMFITATQMVVEEIFLKKRSYAGLQVVGMEAKLHETRIVRQRSGRVHDAGNNAGLLGLFFGYIVSDALFNYCGIMVTELLSAVHRTMIDPCRSILVWAWQLLAFYCIDERYGEEWTKYSGLQVAGFVLIIVGTLIYNGLIKLPWFAYEEPEDAHEGHRETPETGDYDGLTKGLKSLDESSVASELAKRDTAAPL
eukprot:m51a1_g14190 hypothetical protein (397) ;mRNA; f:85692-87139